MFLVVFPADAIGSYNKRQRSCTLVDQFDLPPGGMINVSCPLTGHTASSRGIANTPISTAFRAATQTEGWNASASSFAMAPFFVTMTDEAKKWLLLLRLSKDISLKAFQVDKRAFNDTLHIVGLLCYDLSFKLEGPPDADQMSVRAMKLLTNLSREDATRIRYSLLEFIDHMCNKEIPSIIVQHAGKKSRLSTKYAAVALGNLLSTVDV
jgi:hypothetical protein